MALKTTDTEIASKASFDEVRYAQCWEDADVLLEGLDIQEGDICVGIGSAGENCLSMLTCNPSRVIAVDMNPAQLACIELRIAAFKCLEHGELLELIGSRSSGRRMKLFEKCAPRLPDAALQFWRKNSRSIEEGVGSAGRFERYFSMFRKYVIPLIHSQKKVEKLLEGGDRDRCRRFYDQTWNNWRWRMLFNIFFSRWMMGRLGRDPSFFTYVEGSVADRILKRTRHALRELNPADNPYLHWILTGRHGKALPHALRPENFEKIKSNIDCLRCHHGTLESVLETEGRGSIDRFNLSDIFEYMSDDAAHTVLDTIIRSARSGSRLAYWNMLAKRCCPGEWKNRVLRRKELGDDLLLRDKAFFYSSFIVEEVL